MDTTKCMFIPVAIVASQSMKLCYFKDFHHGISLKGRSANKSNWFQMRCHHLLAKVSRVQSQGSWLQMKVSYYITYRMRNKIYEVSTHEHISPME